MSKISRDLGILMLVTVVSSLVMWLLLGMKVIYENFDGPYYGVIAKTWYVKEQIAANFSFPLPLEYYPAHLPGYPILMNIGGVVTGNVLSGGLVTTILASMIGAGCIYLIWKEKRWGNPLWASLAWLFLWPRMWAVRSIVSPEPLFIVMIILSLWAFDKKKYIWAGLAGAVAVAVKSPGMLLFAAYGMWWLETFIRTKKINWQIWPVAFMPLAFLAICGFYSLQTGDFGAYFNSGDNIHLQSVPFGIFNANQPWVGTVWLEDVLWIYLVGGLGVILAYKKNKVWGWFGIVFLTALTFVSHRDISRYSLPIVPVVLIGLSELMDRREVRIGLLLWLVPIGLFTLNFLTNNTVEVPSLAPFLTR